MMPAPPLSENSSPDLLLQRQLVDALCAPRFFPRKPKVVETHISWVLLTGHDAYKIKKAVELGFLDFSTLELRHFYCTEELRLNRRLAPSLYLGVVAIGGSPEQPVLNSEPAIEYAVHMRRFAQSSMMNRMLARGRVTLAHIDKLAAVIANFHTALPPAAAAGCVRECHGDLHLGNIVLLDDMPTPFDGIEFSAALRWIDVISEISFPVMDLLQRGQPQLAWRL